MSEYQYYEFQAIDQPLTQKQMAALRNISTRAQITVSSFTNEYQWGDLKADPKDLLTEYFDAHLYLANWGTRRVMFRLPRQLVDMDTLLPYCQSDSCAVDTIGEYVILDFCSDQEPGWDDVEGGEGGLASLMTLRADILAGDMRSLYLGWMLSAQSGELSASDVEPPMPAGMHRLSGALHGFVEFLQIDRDLLAVAAEKAATDTPPSEDATHAALQKWIAALPESEKNDLLFRMTDQSGPHLRVELLQRFRRCQYQQQPARIATSLQRPARQLLDQAEQRAEQRRLKIAEQRAKELAQQQRRQARKRAKYLDDLSARQEKVWQQIENLIATKRPNEYAQAVVLLMDLRDLADREGIRKPFDKRIHDLCDQHQRKSGLLRRIDKAGICGYHIAQLKPFDGLGDFAPNCEDVRD